ncbi:MAG TPA: lysophospholipid acyltransferase family protein [Phycisphaerae bacterium]|nr:lysophospholipid acyltransferase family protein [Phycisphaerae bacterium]
MKSVALKSNPFSLSGSPSASGHRLSLRLAGPVLERALGLRGLGAIYDSARDAGGPAEFCEASLRYLNVKWEAAEEQIARIPRSGPLVVVANHPFGALEGVIIAALLLRIRPDVKLLANHLLDRIPELRPVLVSVDPFGGEEAAGRNRIPLRSAIDWVRGGGALAVFPAGEVAHLTLRDRHVAEPRWSATVGKIIRRTSANVVPVFFEGRNSAKFQALGLLHPRVRTALLPRELLNKRDRSIRVAIGRPIPVERLRRFERPSEIVEYLRLRTLMLADPCVSRAAGAAEFQNEGAATIAPAQDINSLHDEIARIPQGQQLAELGPMVVFCCPADSIPRVVKEIGRQREETFRRVGEGTGRGEDLDQFDEHYLHLFAWDREARRLVGAYRLGLSDKIVSQQGIDGIYTHTLFKFNRSLLDQLGPAIELGRSFVVAEYQRSFAPLLLLWKGIGRFLVTHPQYRILFGAVSISDEYESTTKRILMSFLRANCFDEALSAGIKPRNPPRFARLRRDEERLLSATIHGIDEVDELVQEIEADGRGVPILLRQYLKLNAKLLGFNVDPVFGNVLDGLFYVDLTTVERSLLDRYLGREAATAYLAYHRV